MAAFDRFEGQIQKSEKAKLLCLFITADLFIFYLFLCACVRSVWVLWLPNTVQLT